MVTSVTVTKFVRTHTVYYYSETSKSLQKKSSPTEVRLPCVLRKNCTGGHPRVHSLLYLNQRESPTLTLL